MASVRADTPVQEELVPGSEVAAECVCECDVCDGDFDRGSQLEIEETRLEAVVEGSVGKGGRRSEGSSGSGGSGSSKRNNKDSRGDNSSNSSSRMTYSDGSDGWNDGSNDAAHGSVEASEWTKGNRSSSGGVISFSFDAGIYSALIWEARHMERDGSV